jgi:hypothetical protein
MKVPDLDIPSGLEEAFFKVVQFASASLQNKIILRRSSPARRLFYRVADRSYFRLLKNYYNALSEDQKYAWLLFWAALDFSSHLGVNYYPGSAYSAFVFFNAPIYKNGDSIVSDFPGWQGFFESGFADLTGGATFGYSGNQKECEEYTAQGTHMLNEVGIWVFRANGNPTDNLQLRIYSGGATPEAGTLVAGPISISMTTLSNAFPLGGLVRFHLSSPITLSNGTKYYFVLSRSGSLSLTNSPGIEYNSVGGPPYPFSYANRWSYNGAWQHFLGSNIGISLNPITY